MSYSPPRIVCAANRYYDEEGVEILVLGIRHHDTFMNQQIERLKKLGVDCRPADGHQGFVDQYKNFLTREQAWKIAEKNGQIIRRIGGDTLNGGHLFSENLY